VAAATDRLMMRLGKAQRFGTYYRNGELAEVQSKITDANRRMLSVPTNSSATAMAKNSRLKAPSWSENDSLTFVPKV